ncbi:hypothetical protein [Rhodomicrobium udaipurense]|uniref:hypothetical protein n=1 Tax=Rhodomicrobium udaipurense TaxID=1202716 RepID=UPI001FD8CAC1|nr:hypothetical protein [Rhodomicrobium udaipurense]
MKLLLEQGAEAKGTNRRIEKIVLKATPMALHGTGETDELAVHRADGVSKGRVHARRSRLRSGSDGSERSSRTSGSGPHGRGHSLERLSSPSSGSTQLVDHSQDDRYIEPAH